MTPFIAILVAKDFRNKFVFLDTRGDKNIYIYKYISTTWLIINLVIFRVKTKESNSKDNILLAPCERWYRIFALTFWKTLGLPENFVFPNVFDFVGNKRKRLSSVKYF